MEKSSEKNYQYIICRVCGYIEKGSMIDKPCPACGFPKTIWMEYKPRKITSTRKNLLDLHLHPVAVHFPIVGTVLSFSLPILALLAPAGLDIRLLDMATLSCIILPLLVLIGTISGVIGGILRYKSTTAPLLKNKIYISILYFIFSIVQSYYAITEGVTFHNMPIIIVCGILSFFAAAYLAKKGSHLFAGLFGPYIAG